MVRGEDREILLDTATHSVTGTYDRAAQSITMFGILGISGGRERVVWLAAKVENHASSMWPPRSPAVASHASVATLTTLCFLFPRHTGKVGELLKRTVRRDNGEHLRPDTSALTPGPSATGPDNPDGPVPRQPVEGTPQRREKSDET